MRLSLKGLTITGAILWGGAMFLTGIANAIWPSYGVAFLEIMDSVYPGYHATGSFGSVVVGTLYAVLDGAACGLLSGLLYNRFAGA